eukprot:TRINITY_DN27299_c0_g1_i1.p1 TRINITY_DN27299_c0_g1~~TRINITY_DN27299_c0_g1_i1.p1  ORF type:complete len:666 (-),score=136.42 TRINITY_DN27299_c0_g1_i1:124-1836(-)
MPTLAEHLCLGATRCWRLDVLPGGVAAGSAAHPPDAAAAETPAPRRRGCWFRLPSGCPRDRALEATAAAAVADGGWCRDEVGEREFDALSDADACLILRRELFSQWCGVADIQMHHEDGAPEQAAERPRGASVRLPDVLDALGAVERQQPPSSVEDLRYLAGDRLALPRWAMDEVPAQWSQYLSMHKDGVEQLRRIVAGSEYQREASAVAAAPALPRAVIWACHPSLPCGGHGDRLKGIASALALAMVTNRLFFIDAPDPWDLDLFLQPAALDWRVRGLAGLPTGRHVLWDHDLFERSYLDAMLEADEPLWVVYTNKRSILGPILRHPRLAPRALELVLAELPQFTHLAWRVLFRPTAALERHWLRLRDAMGGGVEEPYIAMHHRIGDAAAGFGVVNGEADRRNGMEEVERRLGLPNSTRWFLATDSVEAAAVPQAQVWRVSGKLFVRDPREARVHLASAGVTPPSGARQLGALPAATAWGSASTVDGGEGDGRSDVAARSRGSSNGGWDVLRDARSLVGVADAWADFLALSRARVAVISSSAFGMMAAQAGAVEYAYSAQGCIRLDLFV